jgi:uncharacterized cupin superfamily protein
MEVFNLLDGEVEPRNHERQSVNWRWAQVGKRLGARLIGMSVYELEPGQLTFPYHYELGAEEWLIVLAGRPTLRGPDGEHELRAGDTVCFPEGPAGAHQVRNDSVEPARVAIFSTKPTTAVAVYPDSKKIGVWDANEQHMVRSEPELDYWDGEQ